MPTPEQLSHNVPVGRDPNNGQPAALAKWTDALNLLGGHRVYHLGSGVGYYTAIWRKSSAPTSRHS